LHTSHRGARESEHRIDARGRKDTTLRQKKTQPVMSMPCLLVLLEAFTTKSRVRGGRGVAPLLIVSKNQQPAKAILRSQINAAPLARLASQRFLTAEVLVSRQ
jgi:hypothetical protein